MKKLIQKHWHLPYIKNRFLNLVFQKRNAQAPWLPKDVIFLLNELIKETDIVLEFGSGRSTKWLASRCKYLYSFEHNQKWYDKVNEQINGFKNISIFLAQVFEENPEGSEYLNLIQTFDEQSVDIILNDGKIRGLVAVNSIGKLKSCGIYIIDNAERYICNSFDLPDTIGIIPSKMLEEWKVFVKNTDNWRRIWISDGVSSTLILFKP